MLVSIVRDLGEGPLFYRFAAPKELCRHTRGAEPSRYADPNVSAI